MKNVTVALDDVLARWTRVRAAEAEMSLSRFVARLLRERMESDHAYETARRCYLAIEPAALKAGGGYPSREELHDRPMLRR